MQRTLFFSLFLLFHSELCLWTMGWNVSVQESILKHRIRQDLISTPWQKGQRVSPQLLLTASWSPKDRRLLSTKITQDKDENETAAWCCQDDFSYKLIEARFLFTKELIWLLLASAGLKSHKDHWSTSEWPSFKSNSPLTVTNVSNIQVTTYWHLLREESLWCGPWTSPWDRLAASPPPTVRNQAWKSQADPS